MGSVWECPQLIPLAGKHVLLVSVWEPWVPHYEAYAIGTYANGEFTPETWRRLSYGPSYYAGAAYTDREGRAGIIYWLRGIADPASTWAGANSLPHVLELRDHQVVAQPHPDLDGLRVGAPQVLSGRPLPSDSPQYATCMTPSDLEWQIRVDEGFNQLRLTASDGVVLLDLTVAGGTARACTAGGTWEMPTAGPLRLIVDAPICELFGTRGVLAVPIDHTDGFVKVELVGESQLLVHQLHASPVKVQPLGSPPPAGGRG